MQVTLIDFTKNALDTLIFTKQTRLNMSAANFAEIVKMPYEKKMEHLDYMANSIPSSWEFVDYTFAIEGVSRGFTHQFVRTRTNSYAQQSMRVTNMEGFDYITGPSLDNGAAADYRAGMALIADYYKAIIEQGGAIEDARGILPTNIATNIVAKINLRTLSDMARSRTGGRTQSEYREVMDEILKAVLLEHPWASKFLFPKGKDFFDDLEEYAKAHPSPTNELLKIIDRMRKNL